MDKILITAFRSEIATAILNSQKTDNNLNFHADGYIDEEELPKVLEFFGETDVNKLLKQSDNNKNQSVFTQNSSSRNEDGSEINTDDFSELMNSDNTVLHNEGSAAYELQNNVAGDLVMTSASGTPFSAQMTNLYETRKALIRKHKDTSDIDAKIEALNEAVKEYIKTNHKDVTQALIDKDAVRTFKYGKNGEKTGYFIQTFDFKGGNTMNKNDADADQVSDSDNDDNNVNNNNNNDNDNSQPGVNVKYGIELLTDNLHAIANVEAGSDNSDLQGAVVYSNKLKNGGNINFSGNFRQTIEKNNNQTNFGAAVDYSKNKFSLGAYGCYEAKDVDNEKYKELNVEAYARYGSSLRLAIGHETDKFSDESINYNYAAAKISGTREISSSNLSLTGSVEGKYGIAKTDDSTFSDYSVMAKGGITFKSKNLKANVFANVGIDGTKDMITGDCENVLSTTLVGNVSTGKIDITATLSGMNARQYNFIETNNGDEDIQMTPSRNWGFSSSITLTPKNIFGKNSKVVPSVTYSVSNHEEVKHYVGVNLGVNL